ncbi:MAG: hypothetical protein JWM99_3320 [Verrucomicrobiales bacterium]|nr:hypothetical protein [Verrucomicrobiales bacterium]
MKRFLSGAFVCLALWLVTAHAAETVPSVNKKAKQKVLFGIQNGALTASVGGREASLKNLKFGWPDIELGGVTFRSAPEGKMEIFSDADVVLESPEFKGWSAELPQKVSIGFSLDIARRRLGIVMPLQAIRSLLVFCEVGGQIELKSGAKGQIDFFNNGSYLFKGLGDIIAINSDGQKFDFRLPGSSMDDGPLLLKKPEGGKEYWERASPTIALNISGTPREDLVIKAGKNVIYKTGAENSEVYFDSIGAKISFTEKPDGSLRWKVDKGDFRISIDGILGMITAADSDDEAVMTWNKARSMADVKNLSAEPFRVSLPARSFAIVNFSAEFQFAQVGSGIFSTAAAGGDVHLYNGNGLEISNLQAGSLLMNTKTLRAGLSSGNGLVLRLTWDNGTPLQVSADQAFAAIQPGEERVIKFGREGIAKISYAAEGFLLVEAVQSNFKLVLSAVHGLEIDLVEGDMVALTLDLKKSTFTIKAGDQNVNDVAVTTESGYSPVLEAARALNFNIGKNGALLASSGGQPLFFAAGGPDVLTDGLRPPPPYGQNDFTGLLDPIKQQPVSVSGAQP